MTVATRDWLAACEAEVEAGNRFGGLWADGRAVVARFGDHLLRADASRGIASIVQVVPAADWDEREAAEVAGFDFQGHEPLRPLLEHPADLAAWTVAAAGHDIHQVAVGPIHAGVIESGHFRFQVVGERILHLDPRLFYKHRGLEAAAEGAAPGAGLAFAARACAACSVANGVAYALASEAALGLRSVGAVERARTLLLELERFYNHLNDLSAVCAGVGFAAGSMAFAALKERAHRLYSALFGHRFLFGTVAVGGSEVALDAAQCEAARREISGIADQAAAAWRETLFNPSVDGRVHGVGVVHRKDALQLGAVGPAARASGIAIDARAGADRLAYEGFVPASIPSPSGDVAARFELRAVELAATARLLEGLLDTPHVPAACEPGGRAVETGLGVVESPRGETACAVRIEGGLVGRLHLRTASYANWPVVARAVAGNLLPDFPLINKSFELCYACVDR